MTSPIRLATTNPKLPTNLQYIVGRCSIIMAPRNDTKDGANGSDEPKPEKGYATLATLGYDSPMHSDGYGR